MQLVHFSCMSAEYLHQSVTLNPTLQYKTRMELSECMFFDSTIFLHYNTENYC